MHERIFMAGSGGQGIQFAGQVLALSAVQQGLEATYIPNYGAERRGGPSLCTVVLADHAIFSPVFGQADVLLAFDQRARTQYASQVAASGIILVNSDLASQPGSDENARVISVPASSEAGKIHKSNSALNLVMLGAYLALNRGVKLAVVQDILKQKSKKKPEWLESNLQALQRGAALIQAGG